VTYFTAVANHPFIIEADLPFATLTDVNIPGTNNSVAGGLADPVFHMSYFFISDAKVQRWFGFTDFLWLPLGRNYNSRSPVNVSTPGQLTNTPQFGYTEGLGKISPSLNGLFFDLVANASFHTNGHNPLEVVNPPGAPFPGLLTFDGLTQKPSYDVKAFLRYNPSTFLFAAFGIEKSWGGEQIATNGTFVPTGLPVGIAQPNMSIGQDDFLRGHFQFQVPLAKDFTIAGDVFHDFRATGGFKENIGVEVRLAKFFFPSSR